MAAGDVDVKLTTNRSFQCAVVLAGNKIVVTDNATLDMGTSDYSISAWVKKIDTGIGGICVKRDSGVSSNAGYSLHVQTTVQSYMSDGTGARLLTQGSTVITPNIWYHVCITADRDGVGKAYLNGVNDSGAGTDLTTRQGSVANAINVGLGVGLKAGDVLSESVSQQVRKIRIWNKCLTPTEVLNDYNGLRKTEGLIGEWVLAENYNDTSGNNFHGTNTGTTFAIKEDTLGAVVKAQRTTTGSAGKFLIAKGQDGQVITVGITE